MSHNNSCSIQAMSCQVTLIALEYDSTLSDPRIERNDGLITQNCPVRYMSSKLFVFWLECFTALDGMGLGLIMQRIVAVHQP